MNPNQIQGLNTLRFFAFLSVFIFHATPYFKFGYLGVDFFFVLSSFLLTYLAFTEIETTDNFSRKNFFIRRSLRIYPLYFVVIIFCFTLLPLIAKTLKLEALLPEHKWMFFVFLGNYETSNQIFTVKLLWSIAVEEQFYILFLLLSYTFKKNIYLCIVPMLIVFYSYMFLDKIYVVNTYSILFAHLINFSAGISLAVFYKKGKLPSMKISISAILILSLSLHNFTFTESIFKTLVAILFSFIIIVTIKIASSSIIQKMSIYKAFEYLGKQTYGLYIFSGFTIPFVSKLLFKIDNMFLLFVIKLLVTIVLAWLSYTFLEKKFMNLKDNFRYKKNF